MRVCDICKSNEANGSCRVPVEVNPPRYDEFIEYDVCSECHKMLLTAIDRAVLNIKSSMCGRGGLMDYGIH